MGGKGRWMDEKTDTERERETDRQRYRKNCIHADRKTYRKQAAVRQTERGTHIWMDQQINKWTDRKTNIQTETKQIDRR